MMRVVLGMMMMGLVAACSSTADLQDAPVPLGDFRLEHNILEAPVTTEQAGITLGYLWTGTHLPLPGSPWCFLPSPH